LAGIVSFIGGGWLCDLYGWRMTLFLFGIPGIALAVLVKWTVKEPRVRPVRAADLIPAPPMRVVFHTLWRQRSFRHLMFGMILLYTMGLGLSPWYAAFMMRNHGMGTSELGLWLGTIFGLAGIIGVLLGGYLGSRWFVANERGQMRATGISIALLVPCYVAFLTSPGKYAALVSLFPLVTVASLYLAPAYALMQRLVVDEMRATMMAVVMLLANLIGMGLGPQIVGILSDVLQPTFGPDALRYAMLLMSFVALWAGFHFWRVGRTVQEDLLRVAETRASSLGRLELVSGRS
jgi:predicted MFS family arabinose efflux permease